MSDIVERLRNPEGASTIIIVQDMEEAADTIERLREELDNERARGIHSCGPNCQRLACKQRREIERLQAQVEALQNKCAQRGLSPEDSDRLQTRNERLEELLHEMLQWCKAYPEDIFTPLQGDPIKKTGDYDTEEKRTLITRASASMGRYILKKWPEKIREALAALDE